MMPKILCNMPKKNPWTYKKKRRKTRKGKKDSEQEPEIANPQVPDSDDTSNSIDVMSEIPLPNKNPVKAEDITYPDTRFQRSTTLFPAEEVENITPSEEPSEMLKRSLEDDAFATPSKKWRLDNSPIADECMIIDKPKSQVKVELVDLTGDLQRISETLCSPVKTSFLENRLHSKTLQVNGDSVRIKVEPSETTSEINTGAGVAADIKYQSIAADAEQIKDSEVDMSHVDINKNMDPPVNQVKTEKNVESENNKVSFSESVVEPPLDNHTQIKVEQDKTSENNFKNCKVAISDHADTATVNACLRSEMDKEDKNNKQINDKISISNSAPIFNPKNSTDTTTSDGHPPSDVPIKVEQNENCVISDSSTLIPNISSNIISTEINSADRPVISEQNTNENCEFSSMCCTEIPSVINEQQTKEIKNEALDSSVSNEAQENLISNKNKKNYYNYENPQTYEDVSQKSTYCNNKSTEVVSSVTLIADEFNQRSISSGADDDIFDDGDSQLFEPGIFQTPLLKYLNCNTKVDVLETSHALSMLSFHLNEINVIGSEVIPVFTELPDKSELCSAEKSARLPNLQVDEKQSPNLSVDKLLSEIKSWPNLKDIMNLNPQITNPASPLFEKSMNGNSLDSDGLQRNNSPNILFETSSKMSEATWLSDSDSRTTSPMNNESSFEDNFPAVAMSPLKENEPIATSNNPSMEAKKNVNEKISTDFLRKILDNVMSTEKSDGIAEIHSTLNSTVDPVKSNIFIEESVFENLRKVSVFQNKSDENKFKSDINQRNSERNKRDSETVPKSLPVPNENFKRSREVLSNPPTTYDDAFETHPKRVKTAQGTSKSGKGTVKKLSYEEYKKRDTSNYRKDLYRYKHFASNSSDNSPGSSNFEQNLYPPGNRQNRNLRFGSDTNPQNPGHHAMVNANGPQDPRLARTLQRDLNSQRQLGLYNSQSNSEATKSSVYLHGKQTPSVSTIHGVQNSNVNEPIRPTGDAVIKMRSEINSFHPPDFDNRTSEKKKRVLLPTPVSESGSFSTIQLNPLQSAQGVRDLSAPHFPVHSSPSEFSHSVSQKLLTHMSRHSAPTHESINHEFIPNLPLPRYAAPSPSLPPASSSGDHSHFIASNHSSDSLFHNHKKLQPIPNQPSSEFNFVSLLPRQISEDVGRNIINTTDVYLIIIGRNVDWILGLDKESGISEIGVEFRQVRDDYANHLVYYNTYFPLLLLDCFIKISNVLKGARAKERMDKNLYKVVICETRQSFVSITCDGFVRHSEIENVPKEGHIVLVKFATVPTGSIRILGYVARSWTRAYTHKYDHGHEILKYTNVDNSIDLIKVKIIFHIVFGIPGLNINYPVHISKLTRVSKVLMQNEVLKDLPRSPLCDIILSPRKHDIKRVSLSSRQNTDAMIAIVNDIVQSFSSSTPRLTVVEATPFTDPVVAIVQVVEAIQKSKIPGKILVCTRPEIFNPMGMNLLETSSKLVIINREKEILHENLQSRVLEGMVAQLLKDQIVADENGAKSKVLQEAEVLLVMTGTCFYEDVKEIAVDLAYCIIHDAHHFTEPESLIPLRYGIRHLVLFGDPEGTCHVTSKSAANLGYNKSLFHRVSKLC